MSLIEAMNEHNLDKIIGMYTLPAVHINTRRTTQGLDKMRAWYIQLFNDILPNSKFILGSYSGTGNNRHFTWTATSTKGYVRNGNDTLGLNHDKINYHYSFFNVTP